MALINFDSLKAAGKLEKVEVPELGHFFITPFTSADLKKFIEAEADLNNTEVLVSQVAVDENGKQLFTVEQLEQVPVAVLMKVAQAVMDVLKPKESV